MPFVKMIRNLHAPELTHVIYEGSRSNRNELGNLDGRVVIRFTDDFRKESGEKELWMWRAAQWSFLAEKIILVATAALSWMAIFGTEGAISFGVACVAITTSLTCVAAYFTVKGLGTMIWQEVQDNIAGEAMVCDIKDKELSRAGRSEDVAPFLDELPSDIREIALDSMDGLTLRQQKWLVARLLAEWRVLVNCPKYNSLKEEFHRAEAILGRLANTDSPSETTTAYFKQRFDKSPPTEYLAFLDGPPIDGLEEGVEFRKRKLEAAMKICERQAKQAAEGDGADEEAELQPSSPRSPRGFNGTPRRDVGSPPYRNSPRRGGDTQSSLYRESPRGDVGGSSSSRRGTPRRRQLKSHGGDGW